MINQAAFGRLFFASPSRLKNRKEKDFFTTNTRWQHENISEKRSLKTGHEIVYTIKYAPYSKKQLFTHQAFFYTIACFIFAPQIKKINMKKTFILAALIALIFASCKKDAFNPSNENMTVTDATVAPTKLIAGSSRVALEQGLDGWFPFNGNLKDTLGKLESQQWPFNVTGNFVAGHNGRDKALDLDGTYNLRIAYATYRPKSISVWVKRPLFNVSKMIVGPRLYGPAIFQNGDLFEGNVNFQRNPVVNSKAVSDRNWHHLVITYDGQVIKLYLDGIIQGSKAFSQPGDSDSYYVGLLSESVSETFKGTVDDLRFYSRVLTQDDITALHNL